MEQFPKFEDQINIDSALEYVPSKRSITLNKGSTRDRIMNEHISLPDYDARVPLVMCPFTNVLLRLTGPWCILFLVRLRIKNSRSKQWRTKALGIQWVADLGSKIEMMKCNKRCKQRVGGESYGHQI